MPGTAFLSASQMVPPVLFLRGGGWQGVSFYRGYKQKRLDSFSFPDTHTFVDTRNSYNIVCLIMFSIRVNLLLLTKIVRLLEMGERQEPRVLGCPSPDCPAPADTYVAASFAECQGQRRRRAPNNGDQCALTGFILHE